MNNNKYSTVFSNDFSSSEVSFIDYDIHAIEGDYSVVDAPLLTGKKAFKSTLNINTAYYPTFQSGLPKCELLPKVGASFFEFQKGKNYLIKLKTYLPENLQVETYDNNGMTIFQIHQLEMYGSPIFALLIDKNKVYVNQTTEKLPAGSETYRTFTQEICNLSDLLGAWTDWVIEYQADDFNKGYIQLLQNGKMVANIQHANLYPGSLESYFVLGLYKWNLQQQPTSCNYLEAFYTDVNILKI